MVGCHIERTVCLEHVVDGGFWTLHIIIRLSSFVHVTVLDDAAH